MATASTDFQKLTLADGGTEEWAKRAWLVIGKHTPRINALALTPPGALLLIHQERGIIHRETIGTAVFTRVARAPSSSSAQLALPADVLQLDSHEWKDVRAYVDQHTQAFNRLVGELIDEGVRDTIGEDVVTIWKAVETITNRFKDTTAAFGIGPHRIFFGTAMSDGEALQDFLGRWRAARKDVQSLKMPISDSLATLTLLSHVRDIPRYAQPIADADKTTAVELKLEPFIATLSAVDKREAAATASRARGLAASTDKGDHSSPTAPCDHPHHVGAPHAPKDCQGWHPELITKVRQWKPDGGSGSGGGRKSGSKAKGNTAVTKSSDGIDGDAYSRASTAAEKSPLAESARASRAEPDIDRSLQRDEAILDSGATEHIFYDRSSFVSVTSFPSPRSIFVGDNRSIPAIGYGDVILRVGGRRDVKLRKAWLSPGFKVNLVSTGRLGVAGYDCVFAANRTSRVTDASGKTVLTGTGRSSGNVLDAKIVRQGATAFAAATMDTWHARLHLPYAMMQKMLKDELVEGMDVKGSMDTPADCHCNGCVLGKAHCLSFPHGRKRARRKNELIHIDLAGPVTPASDKGHRFWIGITDDYSARRFVETMRHKSDAEQIIIDYIKQYKNCDGLKPNETVLMIRSDPGGEFSSHKLRDFLAHEGIKHQWTTPRTPQQNGVAERANRTDQEMTTTFLVGPTLVNAKLPDKLWPYALKAAVHVNNRVPRKAANMRTPHELFHGEKPDISYFRIFGAECSYVDTRPHAKNLNTPRARQGQFVGYALDEGIKAYRVYDTELKSVVVVRDVVFREEPILKALKASLFDSSVGTEDEGEQTAPKSAPKRPRIPPITPAQQANPFAALPVEQGEPDDDADSDASDDLVEERAGSRTPEPDQGEPSPPPSPPQEAAPLRPEDDLAAETPPPDVDVPLNDVGSPQPQAPPPRPPTPRPAPALQPRGPRLPPIWQPRVRESPFVGRTSRPPNQRWVNSATSTTSGGVDVKSSPNRTSSATARLPDTADATAHSSRSASATSATTSPDRPGREDEASRHRNTTVAAPPAGLRDEARPVGNIPVQASDRNAPLLPAVSRSSHFTGPTTASDGTRESSDAGAAAIGALGEQSSPPDVPQRPSVVPAPRHDGDPAPSVPPRRPPVEILDDDEAPAAAAHAATPSPSPPPRTSSAKSSTEAPSKPRSPKTTTIPHDIDSFDFIESMDRAMGYATCVDPTGDILTRKEAMSGPHREGFLEAERKEYASHFKHGTWRALRRSEQAKAKRDKVGSRMLYKIKRSADGTITGYKCRLVAQGFTQVYGQNYTETDAPTARWTSIRITLADAAVDDLELHHCDVDTAYLLSPLDEEVYMELPDGTIVRLVKAIYGLKQSARAWYRTLTRLLGTIGLKPSQADPSVFVGTRNGLPVRIVVYVDDLLIAAPNEVSMAALKADLGSLFSVKDLGEAKEFIGLQIVRDRPRRRLFVHQAGYVRRVLERFGFDAGAHRPVAAPMDSRIALLPAPDADREHFAQLEVASGRVYAALVGSLQFMALCTRPDIAQAASTLGRFSYAPTPEHEDAGKRVLRYLAGSPTLGIEYGGEVDEELGRIVGWTDADWAGDPSTRRSRTGFAFKMAGGAISWQSKLQPTVATSTVHAETQGAATAIREGIWLTRALDDFSRPHVGPVTLHADNQGQIAQAKMISISDRAKHYDIQVHFVRERVASGEFNLVYTPTAEQTADVFTKPLARVLFDRFTSKLGLRDLESIGRASRAKAGGVLE